MSCAKIVQVIPTHKVAAWRLDGNNWNGEINRGEPTRSHVYPRRDGEKIRNQIGSVLGTLARLHGGGEDINVTEKKKKLKKKTNNDQGTRGKTA